MAGEFVRDVPVTLTDGRQTTLSDLAGDGHLVVFFYPKAFTGGCTAQACHFRDLAQEFAEAGATIVGVSRDDLGTQTRFAEEHGFGYPLIADPDGEVAAAFGAKRLGPLPSRRQTVVVDRDLRISVRVSSESDMERHADDALAFLRGEPAA